MTTVTSKWLSFAGAALLATLTGSVSAYQENTNITIQEGRININHSFQCGDSNDNGTYQTGEINVNHTVQRCGDNRNQTGQFGKINHNKTRQGKAIGHIHPKYGGFKRGGDDE